MNSMETDIEELDHSREELKRVDHLIYVSLKYTRTCDVFKNIIARIIDAVDFSLTAILKKLQQEGKVESIPKQAKLKCNEIKKLTQDPYVLDLIDFYLMLREIDRADFSREKEYRRHVTMVCKIEGTDVVINIDVITEYYKKVKELLEYAEQFVKGGVRD